MWIVNFSDQSVCCGENARGAGAHRPAALHLRRTAGRFCFKLRIGTCLSFLQVWFLEIKWIINKFGSVHSCLRNARNRSFGRYRRRRRWRRPQGPHSFQYYRWLPCLTMRIVSLWCCLPKIYIYFQGLCCFVFCLRTASSDGQLDSFSRTVPWACPGALLHGKVMFMWIAGHYFGCSQDKISEAKFVKKVNAKLQNPKFQSAHACLSSFSSLSSLLFDYVRLALQIFSFSSALLTVCHFTAVKVSTYVTMVKQLPTFGAQFFNVTVIMKLFVYAIT